MDGRVRRALRALLATGLATEACALILLAVIAAVGTQFPWGPGAWSTTDSQRAQLVLDHHRLAQSTGLYLIALLFLSISVVRVRWLDLSTAALCVATAVLASVFLLRHTHGSAGLTIAVAAGSLLALVRPVHRLLSAGTPLR